MLEAEPGAELTERQCDGIFGEAGDIVLCKEGVSVRNVGESDGVGLSGTDISLLGAELEFSFPDGEREHELAGAQIGLGFLHGRQFGRRNPAGLFHFICAVVPAVDEVGVEIDVETADVAVVIEVSVPLRICRDTRVVRRGKVVFLHGIQEYLCIHHEPAISE